MLPKQMCGREPENLESPMALVPGAISTGTLIVAFGLLAVGFEYFWVTFIVGFGVVLPTAMGVLRTTQGANTGAETDRQDKQGEDAALATLRRRYAQGELSDAEFEHQVGRVLETESPPEASGSASE